MKIPLFPLRSIFFPGETVPLHIFEERYKQLISDCRNEAITFGIPVYINDAVEYGTEVQLVEVVNTYDDGAIDVVCVARQVFKVISFEKKMEHKLYAGGVIEFLNGKSESSADRKKAVLDKIEELYTLMEMPFSPIPIARFSSYILVHKIGLSFEQEYALLKIMDESERLLFIEEHLKATIKVLREIGRTKKKIVLNGHFKNFDPLDFKDLEV